MPGLVIMEQPAAEPAQEEQLRAIQQREQQLRDAEPGIAARPIVQLNQEAVAHARRGDHLASAALLTLLLERARRQHLTHRELHACCLNRAAAYLQLRLPQLALQDAEHAALLLQRHFPGAHQRHPGTVKALCRRGAALLALARPREAVAAYESALACDQGSVQARAGLDQATAALARQLAEGRGLQQRALPPPPPPPTQQLALLPAAAPAAQQLAPCPGQAGAEDEDEDEDEALALKPMTPAQAERGERTRDTHHFLAVMADVAVPRRHIRALQDGARTAAMVAAVEAAVRHVEQQQDRDCRVLLLGAGAGLLALAALRAGAKHVTCCERWLYQAQACKQALLANGAPPDRHKVVCKRYTELRLLEDVPVCCNLIVADSLLDDQLLATGLLPALSHALQHLATHDALVLPAAATAHVAAAALAVPEGPGGLQLGALDRHRWLPAGSSGLRIDQRSLALLSQPVQVWHFDLACPPSAGESRALEVQVEAAGSWNALLCWYELRLFGDVRISTDLGGGLSSLQPCVQYLPGTVPVAPGQRFSLLAEHNTGAMRYSLRGGSYSHLALRDASVPLCQFAMAADTGRLRAYGAALEAAVQRCSAAGQKPYVLDIGAGCGALALLAARAGAEVVAVEAHGALCQVARSNAAANGLSSSVTVVHSDVAALQLGREVAHRGANIVVFDLFDAGLLGGGLLQLLRRVAAARLVQRGAQVVPRRARLYAAGLQVLTGPVAGFDLGVVDKHRWQERHEPVRLQELLHQQLTAPAQVLELGFDFDQPGGHTPLAGATPVQLQTCSSGQLNAVAFWFELELAEGCWLSNRPAGLLGWSEQLPGASGVNTASYTAQQRAQSDRQQQEGSSDCQEPQEQEHHWGQALQYLDSCCAVQPGMVAHLEAKLGPDGLRFELLACSGAAAAAGDAEAAHGAQTAAQQQGPAAGSEAEALGAGQAEAQLPAQQEHQQAGTCSPCQLVPAPRSPWKVSWGGGAAVDNPHYQRLHYCELLVKELLQRLAAGRGARGPRVQEDLALLAPHCGGLQLDPASLTEQWHRLALLEALYSGPGGQQAAALLPEHVSWPPLRLA